MKPTSYRQVPLTRGMHALVDEDDYASVAGGTWFVSRTRGGKPYYARRTIYLGGGRDNARSTSVSMHMFITGWRLTDHINGDGLDNRRSNLRQATDAQNKANRRGHQSNNTSGYVGVCWDKKRGSWLAHVGHGGRLINLGRHPTAEIAAKVRDRKALELHGEFARLNFPDLTTT